MTVFLSTLNQMAVLAIFMLAGFICQRIKLLPDSTATVLSRLETYLIMPAYILNTFISNCTPEILSERLPLLMWGAIVAVLSVAIAYPVGHAFSKEQPLKNIYRYSVAIANAGFMGNAVMLGVFGEEMLFNYMIFMMPLYVVIYSWGMVMLMPAGGERKNPLKNLINPVCISLVLGMLLGILSIQLPGFVTTVLSNTGSCMAPLAMLLTGFTIGTYSLKKLVADKKVYIISVLRLLVIPAFFALVLGLLKMDESYMPLAICAVAMPMGLNTVVIPAAYCEDTSAGASMALISSVLSIGTIPLVFAFLV